MKTDPQLLRPDELQPGDFIVSGEYFGHRLEAAGGAWVQAVLPVSRDQWEIHFALAAPINIGGIEVRAACIWTDRAGRMMDDETGVILGAIGEVDQR